MKNSENSTLYVKSWNLMTNEQKMLKVIHKELEYTNYFPVYAEFTSSKPQTPFKILIEGNRLQQLLLFYFSLLFTYGLYLSKFYSNIE